VRCGATSSGAFAGPGGAESVPCSSSAGVRPVADGGVRLGDRVVRWHA
jgi:hypothetical protein